MQGAAGAGVTEVRPLTSADLDFAAALHSEALPDGFFVSLGRPFLTRYYAAFVASPHAIGLVAVGVEERQGVLVGTIDDAAHYRWVIRHQYGALVRAGARGLARDPRLAARFARTRARRYLRGARLLGRRRRGGSIAPSAPTTGALTHIAVVSERRENGVGTKLVNAYVKSAFAHGALRLRVATKADGGATDFYRHLGWRPAESTRNLDGVDFDVLTLDR